MSEKATADVTSSVDDVENVSAKADKFFQERVDANFQKRLLKLQNMKFKTEADLKQRFPFKDELDSEQGVYSWHDYIVLSQDLVPDVLTAEWKDLPPATGRIKFNSHLKQRYIGISSPQIIEFCQRMMTTKDIDNAAEAIVQLPLLVQHHTPY
jgi:hypothetical protein